MNKLLGSLIFVLWFPTSALCQWWNSNIPAQKEPLITVSGEAVVYAQADVCEIVFGIEVKDSNLKDAREENDKRAASLLATLQRAGVKNKDIQTEKQL